MNSRFTRGVAGLLLVGAIFIGYWGLVISQQPTPVTETVSQPTAPLVALVHDVLPLVSLTVAELARRAAAALTVVLAVPEERRLTRYWAGGNDSSANFYATNSHLFQFTPLALGSASKGLARNDTVATLHPGIEVIRGNHASQQTP